MHRCHFIRFLFFATLLLSSCGRSNKPNLAARIRIANTAQYCHPPDACFNPSILAVGDGYEVTTFEGSKPRNVRVNAKNLARYLQSLPMEAWPRGAAILISPTDILGPGEGQAVQENLAAARQVCESLGLEVQFRPGG